MRNIILVVGFLISFGTYATECNLADEKIRTTLEDAYKNKLAESIKYAMDSLQIEYWPNTFETNINWENDTEYIKMFPTYETNKGSTIGLVSLDSSPIYVRVVTKQSYIRDAEGIPLKWVCHIYTHTDLHGLSFINKTWHDYEIFLIHSFNASLQAEYIEDFE